MKVTNNRPSYHLASRTLKLVGIILILFSLLDYILLFFPADWSNRSWLLGVMIQLVNKGITPLIGMALLFTGFAIDTSYEGSRENSPIFLDLRVLGLFLAALLGVIYFVIFPLHLYNIRIERDTAIAKIGEEVKQKSQQIEAEINSGSFNSKMQAQQDKIKEQVTAVMGNPSQLQAVLNSNQVPDKVKNLIKESQKDPKALDRILSEEAKALPSQLRSQINTEKEQAEGKVKLETTKSTFQTGISSLLLAIGYLSISWIGLKSLGIIRLGRRKANLP